MAITGGNSQLSTGEIYGNQKAYRPINSRITLQKKRLRISEF